MKHALVYFFSLHAFCEALVDCAGIQLKLVHMERTCQHDAFPFQLHLRLPVRQVIALVLGFAATCVLPKLLFAVVLCVHLDVRDAVQSALPESNG
jgi:hypothetical protein